MRNGVVPRLSDLLLVRWVMVFSTALESCYTPQPGVTTTPGSSMMPHASYQITGGLTPSDIQKIHDQAVGLIERVGLHVPH